ncbi:MAG: caspase domain-containing protein [Saprospiraceae bacterium]
MAEEKGLNLDKQTGPSQAGPRGRNYLPAIAINDYLHCSKLNNAVDDVEAFIALMKSRYNFEEQNVNLIKNEAATKKRIEQELIKLARILTNQDNLIIYFSGHGRYDERLGGNWVPVEAGAGDDDWTDYLSNDLVKSYLNRIECFHTFLIADSCFSGSLFIDKSKEKFTGDRRDTDPSRWGLTSGKKEIVSDGNPGEHSPFAAALLDVLEKADQPPGVMRICDLVLEKVAANAQQTPMGSPLAVKGHEGGQFVFHFRADENADWKDLNGSVEGCSRYLALYPDGKYRQPAEAFLAKATEDEAWEIAKAANSVRALMGFENQFPQSSRVASGEVNAEIAGVEEEDLWRMATRSNTIAAYRDYKLRSHLGKYRKEADEAIAKLLPKDDPPHSSPNKATLPSSSIREGKGNKLDFGIEIGEANPTRSKTQNNGPGFFRKSRLLILDSLEAATKWSASFFRKSRLLILDSLKAATRWSASFFRKNRLLIRIGIAFAVIASLAQYYFSYMESNRKLSETKENLMKENLMEVLTKEYSIVNNQFTDIQSDISTFDSTGIGNFYSTFIDIQNKIDTLEKTAKADHTALGQKIQDFKSQDGIAHKLETEITATFASHWNEAQLWRDSLMRFKDKARAEAERERMQKESEPDAANSLRRAELLRLTETMCNVKQDSVRKYKHEVEANKVGFTDVEKRDLTLKFELIHNMLNWEYKGREQATSDIEQLQCKRSLRGIRSKYGTKLSKTQKIWLDNAISAKWPSPVPGQ